MTEHLWPMLMLLALMAGVFSGYPVAFILAGVGILFAVLADVPMLFLSMGVQRIYSGILTNWLLVAIPLFVFMGLMLERSGVAERLLRSRATLFSTLPGGYAFAVALIGVIMAAFNWDPLYLLFIVRDFVINLWETGFAALGRFGGYLVLGAGVVIPVFIVLRLLSLRK